MTEPKLDGLIGPDKISTQKRTRRSGYVYQTVEKDTALITKHQAKGWEVAKRNKKTVRMKKPKAGDVLLEDRAWALLAALDWDWMNEDRQFRANKQAQLSARIKDVKTLAAECSSNGQFTERVEQLQQAVEQFATRSRSLTALLDGRALRRGTRKELIATVVQAILDHHDDPAAAEKIIATVITPFTKPSSRSYS